MTTTTPKEMEAFKNHVLKRKLEVLGKLKAASNILNKDCAEVELRALASRDIPEVQASYFISRIQAD